MTIRPPGCLCLPAYCFHTPETIPSSSLLAHPTRHAPNHPHAVRRDPEPEPCAHGCLGAGGRADAGLRDGRLRDGRRGRAGGQGGP